MKKLIIFMLAITIVLGSCARKQIKASRNFAYLTCLENAISELVYQNDKYILIKLET